MTSLEFVVFLVAYFFGFAVGLIPAALVYIHLNRSPYRMKGETGPPGPVGPMGMPGEPGRCDCECCRKERGQ